MPPGEGLGPARVGPLSSKGHPPLGKNTRGWPEPQSLPPKLLPKGSSSRGEGASRPPSPSSSDLGSLEAGPLSPCDLSEVCPSLGLTSPSGRGSFELDHVGPLVSPWFL